MRIEYREHGEAAAARAIELERGPEPPVASDDLVLVLRVALDAAHLDRKFLAVLAEVGLELAERLVLDVEAALVAVGQCADADPFRVDRQHDAAVGALGLEPLVFLEQSLCTGLRDAGDERHGDRPGRGRRDRRAAAHHRLVDFLALAHGGDSDLSPSPAAARPGASTASGGGSRSRIRRSRR